ncbi:MAG: large-conductance mechanosensitive channel protein MscL [Oscillospiraceae bacterium]|nr:large-conductance mechanosensitive channel protein MscL [Oscillospiraceae bacterium]
MADNNKAKAAQEKTRGFFGEFREFISRGNAMDMAVGVIVGAAFKAIVDSLTADIIMPLIGIFVDQDSFSGMSANIGKATITYGNFIEAVINFIIMAFVIFCMVKAINVFRRKKKEIPAATPAPTKEEELLGEIRDLLKEQNR